MQITPSLHNTADDMGHLVCDLWEREEYYSMSLGEGGCYRYHSKAILNVIINLYQP